MRGIELNLWNWAKGMGVKQLLTILNFCKGVLSKFKPYLRWCILGGTLFFIMKAFKDNWQEVAAVRIDGVGMLLLVAALSVTLISHVWAGWVWLWILGEFNQVVDRGWGIRVFLKTNIAKYLPGNFWHFWGRIQASSEAGIPAGVAILSVLLEPLLMAADGLLIGVAGSSVEYGELQILGLVGILVGIHPKILNPVVKFVGRVKLKGERNALGEDLKIKRYPLLPLVGEILFIGLRGCGFLLTLRALTSVELGEVPQLLSAFCFAYVLGLVVPGAPGGVGVFEATAIALLSHRFPAAILVSAVAFYRLISIGAEASGAGLAWMSEGRVKL